MSLKTSDMSNEDSNCDQTSPVQIYNKESVKEMLDKQIIKYLERFSDNDLIHLIDHPEDIDTQVNMINITDDIPNKEYVTYMIRNSFRTQLGHRLDNIRHTMSL